MPCSHSPPLTSLRQWNVYCNHILPPKSTVCYKFLCWYHSTDLYKTAETCTIISFIQWSFVFWIIFCINSLLLCPPPHSGNFWFFPWLCVRLSWKKSYNGIHSNIKRLLHSFFRSGTLYDCTHLIPSSYNNAIAQSSAEAKGR